MQWVGQISARRLWETLAWGATVRSGGSMVILVCSWYRIELPGEEASDARIGCCCHSASTGSITEGKTAKALPLGKVVDADLTQWEKEGENESKSEWTVLPEDAGLHLHSLYIYIDKEFHRELQLNNHS
jgi:hypothetical protein